MTEIETCVQCNVMQNNKINTFWPQLHHPKPFGIWDVGVYFKI